MCTKSGEEESQEEHCVRDNNQTLQTNFNSASKFPYELQTSVPSGIHEGVSGGVQTVNIINTDPIHSNFATAHLGFNNDSIHETAAKVRI